MKVLMFGWEFPPHISGGLGTACYGLTRGLSVFEDLEIDFVIPRASGDEDRSLIRVIGANEVELTGKQINYGDFLQRINFIEVDSHIMPYTDPEEYFRLVNQDESGENRYVDTTFRGRFEFSGGYGKDLFQEIADYAVVASVLAEGGDMDLIHAHDWLTYPAGIAARQVSGKPLIIHVHATDFDRSGGNVNPAVFEIELKGMHAADRIIAVSNLTRNTIIEKYGIDPDKVLTVYNAVDPVTISPDVRASRKMKEKVVTFLGRVTLQKGPEYFIEVASMVLQKMSNVRFVMAGSGDMLARMIHHAAGLGIMDKFHFTGFLKGDDVYRMLSLSDVYVMPSVSEPFGISPLEAMQSDVPVIISRQSGVSEILKYAVKVDFWDIHAMADAIYGILNYRALSDMFVRYGKLEVENMKWENSARNVRKIYDELI